MKYLKYITVLILTAVLFSSIAVGDDRLAVLDKALEFVVSYEFGQDIRYPSPVQSDGVSQILIERKKAPGNDPMLDLESIVFHLGPDSELRGVVEDKLIAALKIAKTDTAKLVICRHLQTIGTAKCVPVLEGLLGEAKAAHGARFALGRMECPEAGDALYRGLGKTSSKVQAGIINDLANRGYSKATRSIIALLKSDDKIVVKSAARGLGVLGGNDAANSLKAARNGADEAVGNEINNALLNCAAKFVADGEGKYAENIYEDFYANSSEKQFKLAGLRGLLIVRGDDAAALLIDTIKNDAVVQRDAIGLMSLAKGKKATGAFTDMLNSLPDELKSQAIRALGARGESDIAQALVPYTKSQNRDVRIAALGALGGAGDASTVELLLAAAVSDNNDEKTVARASLTILEGKGVDAKLNSMVSGGDEKVCIEAIKAIASRGNEGSFDDVVRIAKNNDNDMVRAEAINTLGFIATKDELVSVVELAMDPKNPSDLKYIERAVEKIFSKIEDPDDRAKPILAKMKKAAPESKALLLSLLGKSGSSMALRTVINSTDSRNKTIAVAAVRALSNWPDTAAADELLGIAEDSNNELYKVLALRGYVRLAALSDNPIKMYDKAMKLASSPAEKKSVLGGIASSDSDEALEMAINALDNSEVQTEAANAAVEIADRIKERNKDKAREALVKIVATVKNDNIRRKAQDILNGITQLEDHITKYWVAVGPFQGNGLDGAGVYAKVFAPENDFNAVEWKPLTQGIGDWSIDLHSQFGNIDHAAVYVRTTVISDIDQDVQIESGADDAMKLWLNGEKIHDQFRMGPVSPRNVITKAKLKKGENMLIMKVADHGGQWAFCSRIRKSDGTRLEGLKFEAR